MGLASECGAKHVAIIMDGNGRWAKARGLDRIEGHKRGAEVVRKIIETSKEFGLEYLTLYAFSTENWRRPKEEVDALMSLLCLFIDEYIESLEREGVRMLASGRIEELPDKPREKLKEAIKRTEGNKSGTVILALNYGGRAEIVDAAKKLSKDVLDGKIKVDDIDEKRLSSKLYNPEVPDPDLLIRTSGEMRLSNFLLWELSYSELYVTNTLWPDFSKEEFQAAIESLKGRKRRFGGV